MFSGTVIHADKIARTRGYPTANLNVTPQEIKMPEGVYAAWAYLDGKKYPGSLVLIDRFNKVEIHLIGYTGDDLYGKTLAIEPVKKVSNIEVLDEGPLRRKIADDVRIVKEFLLGNTG